MLTEIVGDPMKKEPRGWLVWTATGVLWILALAFWMGIFTVLGLGIAEHYEYKVVPEIAKHQYEE